MSALPIVALTGMTLLMSLPHHQEESAEPLPTPWIMNSSTLQKVEHEALLDELARQDVIFLGEMHDNDAGHEFQTAVIQGLAKRGLSLVISMEQFERDVQGVLDDYLAGRIDEQVFLEHSRPWKNYEPHYRPVVEFARTQGLPVLAANVPRRLASDVSMDRETSLADRVFMPRSTSAPEDAYWQRFRKSMRGHGGTEDLQKMSRFYAAQCLKDDAMAECITDCLDVNPHERKVVVHLCGHFHSDYGFGTAARVLQRKPLTRVCVITMETIPDAGELPVDDVGPRGHFVFWTVKNVAAAKPPAE
jgi:uncharacterized iron-regulated protein